MRCISPHEKYSIQVIEGKSRIMSEAGGFARMVELEKPVVANFDKLGLLDHEQEAALMAFDFSGLPEGVHPLARISVFDTETYCLIHYPDEEERNSMQPQIENRLRELATTLAVGEFLVVDPPTAPRPWPKYDEYDVEKILAFQEALGIDPQIIRLYELENAKREEVIEAMLDLEDPARVTQRLEAIQTEEHAKQGEPVGADGGFTVST